MPAGATGNNSAVEVCNSCGTPIDLSDVSAYSKIACPSCGKVFMAFSQFNNFKIISPIAQGGVGAVYRAVDIHLDREVALKVLKSSAAKNPVEHENLQQEARATALINHPNIVKIYNFGQDHGQFYIAMELIGGGSLDDLMQMKGTVDEITVLQTGLQVAKGLQAALEKGFIHRDIKPANILFSDPCTAKLLDFGLARVSGDHTSADGELWGTPHYISPEMLNDQPEDFRSDIYSLGGTLFHALSGRPPYDTDSTALETLKQLKSLPANLTAAAPNVSSQTAAVIDRMISPNPENRYSSYAELIKDLEEALESARDRKNNPPLEKDSPVVKTKPDSTRILLLLWLLVTLSITVFFFVYFIAGIF